MCPPLPVEITDGAQEKTAELLRAFLGAAGEILKDEPDANAITMRGIAALEEIPSVTERFKVRAAAIAGYPMYRGVAGLVGMDVLPIAQTPDEVEEALRSAIQELRLHVRALQEDRLDRGGRFVRGEGRGHGGAGRGRRAASGASVPTCSS